MLVEFYCILSQSRHEPLIFSCCPLEALLQALNFSLQSRVLCPEHAILDGDINIAGEDLLVALQLELL